MSILKHATKSRLTNAALRLFMMLKGLAKSIHGTHANAINTSTVCMKDCPANIHGLHASGLFGSFSTGDLNSTMLMNVIRMDGAQPSENLPSFAAEYRTHLMNINSVM